MEVFDRHDRIPRRLRDAAVAIGNFDGVHVGHRHILARARQATPGGDVVALTFSPHPSRLLAPGRALRLLTPPARKLELLAAAGVDVTVVEPFDDGLRSRSPADFARRILADGIGARHVLVGADFRFGRDRAGTIDTLRALGEDLGFAVAAVEPVRVAGLPASSTRARDLLAGGEVAAAAAVLGRDFDADGEVVRGAGRGRGLGVPTANVVGETEALPALGIYAVWLERLGVAPGRRLPGAASLGTNPTFGANPTSLEVHLIDWSGDLYGERVRVGFVERLRGEERFPDVASLVAQMARDIDLARTIHELAARQSGAL